MAKKKPLKIAILTPTLYRHDGIATVARRQAEDFAGKGYGVKIMAFGGDCRLASQSFETEVLGAPNSSLLKRIYWLIFPLNLFTLMKSVKKLKDYNVVISHHYPMNCLASLAKTLYHSTYVHHYHGSPPSQVRQNLFEKIYQITFNLFSRMSLANVDSIITISKYLQRELKNELGRSSRVIYNRVDTSRFCERVDGSKIREEQRLGTDPVILFVGRVDPYKGVHLLIKAFKIVKSELQKTKLLIVGKQNYRKYVEGLNQISNSSVMFMGYVADRELPHLYGACDVYSTASLWESFDLPLVEAQACGKPVVAFDLGSHREVVNDGVTGLLVQPRDCDALARAIIRILKNRDYARQLGRNGCREVREKFSSEHTDVNDIAWIIGQCKQDHNDYEKPSTMSYLDCTRSFLLDFAKMEKASKLSLA